MNGWVRVAACFTLVAMPRNAGAVDKVACATAAELGQRLTKEHKLVAAREQLLVCSSTDCPEVITQDCTQWLGQVDRSMASLVFKPRDDAGHLIADVRVSEGGVVVVDRTGEAPVEIDPGHHELRFEKTGLDPITQSVDVAEGRRGQEVVVVMHPEVVYPPPPLVPIHTTSANGGILAAAVATSVLTVVGVGLFSGFGVAGINDQNGLRKTCAPNCTPAQTGPVSTEFTVANVSLVTALVGLVATGVLWVVWAASSSKPPAHPLALRIDF